MIPHWLPIACVFVMVPAAAVAPVAERPTYPELVKIGATKFAAANPGAKAYSKVVIDGDEASMTTLPSWRFIRWLEGQVPEHRSYRGEKRRTITDSEEGRLLTSANEAYMRFLLERLP